ncbi:hypothetical protein [Janthinobacterium lividum]|uniref:hypothetical protein n=1 Tax=Janthinobacterium lividum TaxID=29581 RepID=UPI0012683AFE|nr:hypothetical protein [Janthinobacterium lividum]
MSESTTVALHGDIFQMMDSEQARLAAAWIHENEPETSQFNERFPAARKVAGIFMQQLQRL